MELDAKNLMNVELQYRFTVIYETHSTFWAFSKKKKTRTSGGGKKFLHFSTLELTVCPRSSYLIYKVSFYVKWVTTSWTDSKYLNLICGTKGQRQVKVHPLPHTSNRNIKLFIKRELKICENKSCF